MIAVGRSAYAPMPERLLGQIEEAITAYEAEETSLSAAITTAQGCADNSGTPTAQCLSLYG